MRKWHKINLVLFLVMIFATCSMVYILGTMNFSTSFSKPWHLSPSIPEDLLSQRYERAYSIEDKTPLHVNYFDRAKVNVFIMVDAWGVPEQEDLLIEDLKPFEKLHHKFILHQRLANNTPHAEHVEYRNNYDRSIFLFGGDSLQYRRAERIPNIGFQTAIFCQRCSNDSIFMKLDSLLTEIDSFSFIAWTALVSADGNHEKIRVFLKKIADVAEKHPEVHFVVQGTHRPILCKPEIKKKYKSHWVPAVFINCTLKKREK